MVTIEMEYSEARTLEAKIEILLRSGTLYGVEAQHLDATLRKIRKSMREEGYR